MRHFLALLAFVGVAYSLALHRDSNSFEQRPPLGDLNPDNDGEGRERRPNDPVAAFDRLGSEDEIFFDSQCDFNAITAASGDKLVDLVKKSLRTCVNGVFSVTGQKAKDACNEQDVTKVAAALQSTAQNYDGNKPGNSAGILSLAAYVRGCLYSQSVQKQDIGDYSANLKSQVKSAMDAFFNRPTVNAQNAEHYEIFSEIITLVSNAGESLNYASKLSELLTKLADWRYTASSKEKDYQGNVMNAFNDNFFRSHYDKDKATAYYKQHPEVARNLNDFMDKHGDLVNGVNEWVLRNAAYELSRFLQYTDNYSTYSGYVKSQLKKYTISSGQVVYAAIAANVDYYDKKNCNLYNVCNYKADLEKGILPFTKNCGKVRLDTFVIRAQQITEAEATSVCQRLKDQETYFHNLLKDNWQPLNPDTNDKIEVVIFNDVDSYKNWAGVLFGIATNNGGIYIEGDPSKPGNVARYFCYERPQNGKFDVWNLEHEFSHYLDARYNLKGDFTESSKGRMVWWIEGLAQYAANKKNYSNMVQSCYYHSFPLSTIFTNKYGDGEDRIYNYGYLASRFMFERHRPDVDTMLGHFRKGSYDAYETFLTSILQKYDQEFDSWCQCIADGKPC